MQYSHDRVGGGVVEDEVVHGERVLLDCLAAPAHRGHAAGHVQAAGSAILLYV